MAPPTSKYEISIFETSDHTDGRVYFPGLLVTVPGGPGCISSPLAMHSDLRQDPGAPNPMMQQPKLCGDVCPSTLR